VALQTHGAPVQGPGQCRLPIFRRQRKNAQPVLPAALLWSFQEACPVVVAIAASRALLRCLSLLPFCALRAHQNHSFAQPGVRSLPSLPFPTLFDRRSLFPFAPHPTAYSPFFTFSATRCEPSKFPKNKKNLKKTPPPVVRDITSNSKPQRPTRGIDSTANKVHRTTKQPPLVTSVPPGQLHPHHCCTAPRCLGVFQNTATVALVEH